MADLIPWTLTMNDDVQTRDTMAADDDELRSLIAALDNCVPRDGSWVELTQYGGGPDEGRVVGNRNGYRRLGIEFLRATVDHRPGPILTVDLEYLVSPDSTINFDVFELADTRLCTSRSCTWINRLIPIGCLVLLVLAFLLMVIGMSTVVRWIGQ